MRRNRVSSALIGWIMKLDAADLPLLHVIPPNTKRRFVRRVLGGLRSVHQDGPVKLNGVWFDTPNTVQNRMFIAKDNDAIRRVMERGLRPGMTVVDVGANVGYHTILAAKKVGPSGRVYAFEPLPDNVRVLEENVLLNGLTNVTVVPCAAGRCAETRTLYIRDSLRNSLFPQHMDASVAGATEVSVVAIDDVVDCNIGFVKIDVEGAELDVLEGMQRAIHNRHDIQLIVEWNPPCQVLAGRDPEQLPLWLIDAGFKLRPIDDRFTGLITQANIAKTLHELSQSKLNWTDLHAARSRRC